MDYSIFKNILSKESKGTTMELDTLGRRSTFKVEVSQNNGDIVLINSAGNARTMCKEDFDICKKKFCSLNIPEKYKGKSYTDPSITLPIARTHGPLIPSIFRHLESKGYKI